MIWNNKGEEREKKREEINCEERKILNFKLGKRNRRDGGNGYIFPGAWDYE